MGESLPSFGLKPAQWLTLKRLAIDPLKAAGAKIWIFGSRANGTYREFSDIDILYELPSGASLPQGAISTIREELEESDLPLKVDLVEWTELAESFRPSVAKARVRV